MSIRKLTALAFAICATAAASAAQAATISLPAATFRGGVKGGAYQNNYTGPNSIFHSDSFDTISAASSVSPGFNVSTSGTSTDLGAGAIGEAHAKYYFALISPVPTILHMLINATATAGGSGSYFAEAEVDINAKDGTLNKTLAYAHACNNVAFCNSFQNVYGDGGEVAITLAANKIYSISMDVDGYIKTSGSTFSAFADPLLSFDPAFDHPNDVTIEFSANLPQSTLHNLFDPGPSGAVPEPSAWAMMLVGFGGLGAALRRRRLLAA